MGNHKTVRKLDGKLYKLVFCRFRVVNGKRIYPKKAKCFCFLGADKGGFLSLDN